MKFNVFTVSALVSALLSFNNPDYVSEDKLQNGEM